MLSLQGNRAVNILESPRKGVGEFIKPASYRIDRTMVHLGLVGGHSRLGRNRTLRYLIPPGLILDCLTLKPVWIADWASYRAACKYWLYLNNNPQNRPLIKYGTTFNVATLDIPARIGRISCSIVEVSNSNRSVKEGLTNNRSSNITSRLVQGLHQKIGAESCTHSTLDKGAGAGTEVGQWDSG